MGEDEIKFPRDMQRKWLRGLEHTPVLLEVTPGMVPSARQGATQTPGTLDRALKLKNNNKYQRVSK